MLFQLAHTAFACISLDDGFEGSLGEGRFLADLDKTIVFQFAGNQVALGYLYFFLGDISAHLYDFHTVEQRTGDCIQLIGCGYKHGFGQVVIDIEIIVVESRVLFRIKHLEQSRRGVAIMGILCNLVNLVEDEDRVGRTCLLEALDDTAGQGTRYTYGGDL